MEVTKGCSGPCAGSRQASGQEQASPLYSRQVPDWPKRQYITETHPLSPPEGKVVLDWQSLIVGGTHLSRQWDC